MNNCNEFLPISNSEIGIGQTTCATQKEANLLVQILLDKGLLACGQIQGPISSKYFWKGQFEENEEWRISLKFNMANLRRLSDTIIDYHPYENPEWIYWEAKGSLAYVDSVNNPPEK